eukprot:748880-Hanusia_phi.AAC.5
MAGRGTYPVTFVVDGDDDLFYSRSLIGCQINFSHFVLYLSRKNFLLDASHRQDPYASLLRPPTFSTYRTYLPVSVTSPVIASFCSFRSQTSRANL